MNDTIGFGRPELFFCDEVNCLRPKAFGIQLGERGGGGSTPRPTGAYIRMASRARDASSIVMKASRVPKRQSSGTFLSIVANRAPSLAVRRFARWLKGLSRSQMNELIAIATWMICVYLMFVVMMTYKLKEFVVAVQYVWQFGSKTMSFTSEWTPDFCAIVNFFGIVNAVLLCSYEALASWGTPKGRGAHAAYCRRGSKRQMLCLAAIVAPHTLSNFFGCKLMRSMSLEVQRIFRSACWAVFGFGFRHGIAKTRGTLPLIIITARTMGEQYAAGTVMSGEEVIWDVLVPLVLCVLSAAYFERRDIAWYGGLSAERRTRPWIYGEKSKHQ